jgi:uncharacterized membrane protein YvbJ
MRFCSNCGAKIDDKAVICVKCGVSVKNICRCKSKSTAVVLAIFVGIFSWLYTYKYDAWKFWAALIINIILFWTLIVPVGIFIWVIVDVCVKDSKFYEEYYN